MGFFDGGGKAVKFEGINQGASGYIIGQAGPGGTLVPYVEQQQTDFTTKEPATYKDGNPIMQAVILLQTDERVDEDDDGQRTVYVNKTRMKRAIQHALRDAGAGDLAIGGVLTIWMTGTEPSKGGGSPAKTFAATYSAPVGALAVSAPAVSAPPAAPAPVAAPPAPPVPAAPPAPPAPVAAPPAPPAPAVAPPAPPVPVAAAAPVAAPPAPPAAPYAPPAPPAAATPAAPVAPAMAVPQGASDLPF